MLIKQAFEQDQDRDELGRSYSGMMLAGAPTLAGAGLGYATGSVANPIARTIASPLVYGGRYLDIATGGDPAMARYRAEKTMDGIGRTAGTVGKTLGTIAGTGLGLGIGGLAYGVHKGAQGIGALYNMARGMPSDSSAVKSAPVTATAPTPKTVDPKVQAVGNLTGTLKNVSNNAVSGVTSAVKNMGMAKQIADPTHSNIINSASAKGPTINFEDQKRGVIDAGNKVLADIKSSRPVTTPYVSDNAPSQTKQPGITMALDYKQPINTSKEAPSNSSPVQSALGYSGGLKALPYIQKPSSAIPLADSTKAPVIPMGMSSLAKTTTPTTTKPKDTSRMDKVKAQRISSGKKVPDKRACLIEEILV